VLLPVFFRIRQGNFVAKDVVERHDNLCENIGVGGGGNSRRPIYDGVEAEWRGRPWQGSPVWSRL